MVVLVCCAENEEANPWEPLHVERGYARDQSKVTVVGAEGTMYMNTHSKDVAELTPFACQVSVTLAQSRAKSWNSGRFLPYPAGRCRDWRQRSRRGCWLPLEYAYKKTPACAGENRGGMEPSRRSLFHPFAYFVADHGAGRATDLAIARI